MVPPLPAAPTNVGSYATNPFAEQNNLPMTSGAPAGITTAPNYPPQPGTAAPYIPPVVPIPVIMAQVVQHPEPVRQSPVIPAASSKATSRKSSEVVGGDAFFALVSNSKTYTIEKLKALLKEQGSGLKLSGKKEIMIQTLLQDKVATQIVMRDLIARNLLGFELSDPKHREWLAEARSQAPVEATRAAPQPAPSRTSQPPIHVPGVQKPAVMTSPVNVAIHTPATHLLQALPAVQQGLLARQPVADVIGQVLQNFFDTDNVTLELDRVQPVMDIVTELGKLDLLGLKEVMNIIKRFREGLEENAKNVAVQQIREEVNATLPTLGDSQATQPLQSYVTMPPQMIPSPQVTNTAQVSQYVPSSQSAPTVPVYPAASIPVYPSQANAPFVGAVPVLPVRQEVEIDLDDVKPMTGFLVGGGIVQEAVKPGEEVPEESGDEDDEEGEDEEGEEGEE
jgi:hypothetical protein